MTASTHELTVTNVTGDEAMALLRAACLDKCTASLSWVVAAEVEEAVGYFDALRDEGIHLKLPVDDNFDLLPTGDAALDVEFELNGLKCGFTVHGVVDIQREATVGVTLQPPAVVWTLDRRRSNRRQFRAPSLVLLWSPSIGRREQMSARLLNLGEHGLAVLATAPMEDWIKVGEIVRVEFHVDEYDAVFDLAARVVSHVEGGTPENKVIGLEFVEDTAFAAVQPELKSALSRFAS